MFAENPCLPLEIWNYENILPIQNTAHDSFLSIVAYDVLKSKNKN